MKKLLFLLSMCLITVAVSAATVQDSSPPGMEQCALDEATPMAMLEAPVDILQSAEVAVVGYYFEKSECPVTPYSFNYGERNKALKADQMIRCRTEECLRC